MIKNKAIFFDRDGTLIRSIQKVKSKTKLSYKKNKIYCFDIDGVICKTIGNDYKNSRPNQKAIKKINQLYNKGFRIKIHTARFMGRNNEKVSLAKKQGYNFTYRQLKNWGVNFHKLILGKPSYDIIFDDKAYGFKKNWFKEL